MAFLHAIIMVDYVARERIPDTILSFADELAGIRRDIHTHPELGFDTARTCGVIGAKLAEWGIAHNAASIPGGVIALVEGERPGPTIALRADMDALAVSDGSSVPWRSVVENRSHGCGHDGHTAWLLSALRALSVERDFPGRVIGIFQPAEEIGRGAARIVRSGLFDRLGPAEIYGAHGSMRYPAGEFGIQAGPMQASCDYFYITLRSRAPSCGHCDATGLGFDPAAATALLSQSLQAILASKVAPTAAAKLSITAISSGELSEPMMAPETLELAGTIQAFSEEVRDLVAQEVRVVTERIARSLDLGHEVRIDRLTPPLINSEVPARAAARIARRLFGEDCVRDVPRSMSGEDFAEYLRKMPGVQMYVGLADASHSAERHTAEFDFNDAVIPLAAHLLSTIARMRLEALAPAAADDAAD